MSNVLYAAMYVLTYDACSVGRYLLQYISSRYLECRGGHTAAAVLLSIGILSAHTLPHGAVPTPLHSSSCLQRCELNVPGVGGQRALSVLQE